MTIEELLIVSHLDAQSHTVLQVAIEVDQVRINVVEQRALGLQTEYDCESTAERFDVTPIGIAAPDGREMRHEPTLAAGPFQRRLQRRLHAAPFELSRRQSEAV